MFDPFIKPTQADIDKIKAKQQADQDKSDKAAIKAKQDRIRAKQDAASYRKATNHRKPKHKAKRLK